MTKDFKIYRQIQAAGSASLVLIAVGYHTGWASPSLSKLQSADSEILITSDQGSWIASFVLIGSIFGSILSFFLVDKLGRKFLLLLTAIPLFLSCILIAVANSYWWFYIARFVAGASVGSIYTVIPMYMGEIAEDRIRGGLGTLMSVMINVGFLIPYLIGPWVSIVALAAVGAIIPIVFTLAFAWVPESPYYYAMKNVQYKVEESLIWLRGSPEIDEEVQKVQRNVDFKRNRRGKIKDLFTIKVNRKALMIVIGLKTCDQLSGSAAILAYSTIIMDEVDAKISSSVVVIIIGIVQLIISISVIFLADKLGRRPLLLASTILCTIFLLGQSVYFQLQANGIDVKNISWLPVVAMIGYFIAYSGGLGTLPILISAELFALEVKAFAMTINSVYFCAAGISVTKSYQIITDAYGVHIAFYIFAVCCVLSTIFIFFVVPETKNRSLSDIQDDLDGHTAQPMLPASNPE